MSGQFDWAMLWLYVLAPVVGAALAALLFRALNADHVKRVAEDRAPDQPAKQRLVSRCLRRPPPARRGPSSSANRGDSYF